MQRISVVDSHTGGEPTRVVISGGPELGFGSLAEQLSIFERDFDRLRRAIVCEPRGSDVIVGALLTKAITPECVCGVIFFNNVGYLGMCGHGLIGLITTLAHLGKISVGTHKIDTPVGVVSAELLGDGRVRIQNVKSYRRERSVEITLQDGQLVRGDIAWGGNWFFLCSDHKEAISASNIHRLTPLALEIRRAVNLQWPEVDHIELFGPPLDKNNHARSFVLCPGGAYDRSPCGTGTSAKLACLFADNKLKESDIWRQESVIGSVFLGSVEAFEDGVIPTITGQAFVNAEATLLLDPSDPFCFGI
jgi:4-hydroxyproline epimerase